MAELSIRELNKFYGENHILKGITFEVFRGEKIGLLGKNGSGKSTLFKAISGLEVYESGFIDICSGRKVGILDQIPEFPEEASVLDVLNTSFSELTTLHSQMEELEVIMGTDTSPAILSRYGSIQAKYEALGGYTRENRIERVCTGLQIPGSMKRQFFNRLSGGEKTRVNLARIMLQDADILLLDEPTNHLDISSVEWLEEFLRQFNGTILVVSHDRYFLDNVVGRIIELENGKAVFYEGNYSYYVIEKEARLQQQTENYIGQQKEIKRLQAAADRMHEWARNADNKALHIRAFNIEKRIEHMDKVDKPVKERKLSASFQENRFSGKEVITLREVTKSYGSNPVLDGITLNAWKGDRIALLGANGSGKTTLIKLLLGEETPDGGSAGTGQSINCCYLPQQVTFEHPQFTVLDTVRHALETNEEKARQRLAAYHFSGKDSQKRVEALSGGEKSRLRLCVTMQENVNLLILDEPTNHLDISSREWIEAAVADFGGTLLFVSHDRYFIRRFATRIWELENGKITDFNGSYEEFRAWKQQPAEPKKAIPAKSPGKPDKQVRAAGSETTGQAIKSGTRTAEEIEQEIAKAEGRIGEIDLEMESTPGDYLQLNQLFEEKKQLQAELDKLYSEWIVSNKSI